MGLAAAYELTKAGHYAQVFEQAPFLGGQASTFEVGGGRLERGYHHLFLSDVDITDLIHELGLEEKLAWLESKVGLFYGGEVWSFATPIGPPPIQAAPSYPASSGRPMDLFVAEDQGLAQV